MNSKTLDHKNWVDPLAFTWLSLCLGYNVCSFLMAGDDECFFSTREDYGIKDAGILGLFCIITIDVSSSFKIVRP